jgi:hypothetical protein
MGLVLATLTVVSTATLYSVRGRLKDALQRTLRERFHADVQVDNLRVVVFPHILATAEGITLRMNGRTDVPPLIAIQKFTLSASLIGLLHEHISRVHIQGLQIRVPPKPPGFVPSAEPTPGKKISSGVVIDQIVSDNALLETLPGDPKHVVRDFNIYHLVMDSFSFDGPASFHATLTNPLPLGQIATQGQFGPWDGEQPGNTFISGKFQYSNVDFSSIGGLAGTMSSSGTYNGSLDQLDVVGDTHMPNFALAVAGNPMLLDTHYVAVVDGTNGDTYLKSVQARLGDSPLSVAGVIVGIPNVPGKQITLEATSHNARTQDLVGLAVKGGSPIDGAFDLHTTIDIPPAPPGKSDVLDRLSLRGQFSIGQARFTSSAVQGKLDSLSRAGQGQPKNDDIENVISNLRGKFNVEHGRAVLQAIEFDVPGAAVQLDGFYNLRDGEMDFHGHLNLDAKISQTTTGAKSVLLRLVDPFFKKSGGGSSIPIKIAGNRDHPNFGIDLHPHKKETKLTSKN